MSCLFDLLPLVGQLFIVDTGGAVIFSLYSLWMCVMQLCWGAGQIVISSSLERIASQNALLNSNIITSGLAGPQLLSFR